VGLKELYLILKYLQILTIFHYFKIKRKDNMNEREEEESNMEKT